MQFCLLYTTKRCPRHLCFSRIAPPLLKKISSPSCQKAGTIQKMTADTPGEAMLQKLMKVSIFYHHCRMWARQHGCSIDDVLEQVRSLGITHVEADRDEIGNTKDFDALLARHDLLVSSIYGFYEWGRDPSDFHNLLQLDQAQILHSPEVMFVPGLCRFRNPLLRLAERQRMQEGLAAMTAKALEKRIVPTIEDFDNAQSPIAASAGMKQFEDRIPGLRTTLDTGNFLFSGEDVLQAMDVLKGTIWHVHLKDRVTMDTMAEEALSARGEPTKAADGRLLYPCAAGQGIIPMKEVLARLHAANYRGTCALEFFGVLDYRRAVLESVSFLKGTGYFPELSQADDKA